MNPSLSGFLQTLLVNLVGDYRKFFGRTFGVALIYSVACLLGMTILLWNSGAEVMVDKTHVSLLSYFFTRLNAGPEYAMTDLSKVWFLFLVSLFTVSLLRVQTGEADGKEISFVYFIQKANIKDVFFLLITVVICSVIDPCLNLFCNWIYDGNGDPDLRRWGMSLLFQLRIYIPMVIFAIVVQRLTGNRSPGINFRKLILILVAFWMFNEFAYELSLAVRSLLFALVLIPFKEESKFIYESILGTGLIAFYFIGYYSVFTSPFGIFRAKEPDVKA
jgi:hypothetical protein